MRLAVIVTEYPKTTETFILRDLMAFLEAGIDLRLYHLAPYRRREILHEFAVPTRAFAHSGPELALRSTAAFSRRASLAPLGRNIVSAFRGDPLLMGKSLALLPVSLAIAEDMLAWGADHVHAEFAGHPATAAWIANRATGLPYSVSCRAHDIFRTQRLLAEKLGAASFVRTVSDYAKAFLLDRVPGLDPGRLVVIHSSVDVGRLDKLPPPLADPFSILYVGSLQPRKGVDILLRSLAGLDLPGWRCSIVGDGPQRGELERLASSLGLGGRVVFRGAQPIDAVMSFYEGASVVVAPSIIGPQGRTEGIPNVMIEALALQRPVISTRVSGIPELVRHGETGLLTEPGSVEELRAALARTAREPGTAFSMARHGRALVEAEFDLRVNARRQLDLFAAHCRPARAEVA